MTTPHQVFSGLPPFASTPEVMLLSVICDRGMRPPRPDESEAALVGLDGLVRGRPFDGRRRTTLLLGRSRTHGRRPRMMDLAVPILFSQIPRRTRMRERPLGRVALLHVRTQGCGGLHFLLAR